MKRDMAKEIQVYLDIETSSLDADSGMIVAVGYARGEKKPEVVFVRTFEDEKTVIAETFKRMEGQKVVTFNGTDFDIPFLVARGLKYDLYLPAIKMIDLYGWAKRFLKLQSRRFHEICVFYSIPHEEISGKEVNELFIKAVSGDQNAKDRIVNHLTQDVKALRAFHQKIRPLLANYPPPDFLNVGDA